MQIMPTPTPVHSGLPGTQYGGPLALSKNQSRSGLKGLQTPESSPTQLQIGKWRPREGDNLSIKFKSQLLNKHILKKITLAPYRFALVTLIHA